MVGTRAFPNIVEFTERIFEKLGFRVDVEEVGHPGGRVLVFHVPSRPRGSAYQLDGAYLMRSGENLVPMTEDRLRTIFSEGKPDWLEEPAMRDIGAARVVEVLDTQGFYELIKRPHPTTRDGVIDGLIAERFVDEVGDQFAVRRIGALLLAKRLSDFQDVARKTPRVVVYTGTSKLETRLDQAGVRGYAVGFQSLVRFVMSHLPQNEAIKDALRAEERLVPDIAIREVVANALIHQDFTIGGTSVMIEVYSDRVEVSNPGIPIVPVERFIDGYQSRNERLADLMRRMGICEEKSSGIDKLVHAAELFQLPAPEFRVGNQRTSVVIYGPRPFEEMDRADRVRACYQHCVLRYVMSQHMTNQTLRERFHLPESKGTIVSQIIAATIEAGWIKLDERVGTSRKLARYLPAWA